MFRNPRENAARQSAEQLKPSLGRPPSPSSTPLRATNANTTPPSSSPATTKKTMPSTLAQTARPPAPSPRGKNKGNTSILSFFKKADRPEESMFYGSSADAAPARRANRSFGEEESAGDRFQENGAPVKRRKTEHEQSPPLEAGVRGRETFDDRGCTPPPITEEVESAKPGPKQRITVGPFVDESDSDEEDEDRSPVTAVNGTELLQPAEDAHEDGNKDAAADGEAPATDDKPPARPAALLKRASTSLPELDAEDFADFEGMDDFDDEYEDGEEVLNRRMMQELGADDFEGAFEGEEPDVQDQPTAVTLEASEPATPATKTSAESGLEKANSSAVASCPICSVSFEGVTDQEASVHVNHCLDGNPTPLPASNMQPKVPPPPTLKKETSEINANTFKRPPKPAKPGQNNPTSMEKTGGPSSAFSKLMSGHSEENAFAEAAASEKASYGKPSHKRTCPFYKILPGFNICVDAFRYGAVQGCNAYFLSHFHSDHYVGLTSSWTHGPIYCSDVTARLVVQQLRVDPKYVVALEWEKEVTVPDTPGVRVTMIPANHCPGSSIFLYEQPQPSARKGGPQRLYRVLHCGDFRACPAHVQHPLLMPDVVDKVSGKLREQRIDVCYLDTTYLNPRWAFPSQEAVIQACSSICATLNESGAGAPGSLDDPLKKLLRGKDAGSMIKFVRTDSSEDTPIPAPGDSSAEAQDDDAAEDASSIAPTPTPPIGALARDPTAKLPLLVVVGTYSIGKERICLGIARALNSLIYAPPGKQRIVAALRDAELSARMTSDPRAAQVHMTPLFEIRPDTLAEYADAHAGRFARAVAFRPSGWNFRSPGQRGADPAVADILHAPGWKSTFGPGDCAPQRGSTPQAAVFGVPYSEHSSFRELAMFVCALRIEKVVPTVNVGSAVGRARMKGWVERWMRERRRAGLFRVVDEEGKSAWYPGEGTWKLRTTI